ncbi:signal peptidase II [Pseudomonas kurunegalensis]|uniref:signal peptidase II n=2 Tax=Pseudomonadaceae TaxID=135621 RepID=UPI0007BA17E0|nr:signal peptidase II [Stutzerimonas frequens]MBK3874662.1 lipoprotein signal peptidase [Stutzerimonas frequens]MBK3912931.1 lipoprotein signal peptidase [Stutzerimonas frequens]MBK3932177.1 lipoprotein signal peptidase [Stutzerimonas frequens]HCI3983641.1 lipoprotein signal peptidase [Pseudomonas aeruginosa]
MFIYGSRLAEQDHERKNAMRWLWLSLLLLCVDQASKYTASTMLEYGESVLVTSFFNWVHRHNTGAAFSFLADGGGWQQPLFIGVALLVSILLVYWLWRSPRVLSYRLALSAILGGALGNVADRLRMGYVEDFLDFHYAQWHWPSFNLADVWIVFGAALIIWAEMRHQPDSQRR